MSESCTRHANYEGKDNPAAGNAPDRNTSARTRIDASASGLRASLLIKILRSVSNPTTRPVRTQYLRSTGFNAVRGARLRPVTGCLEVIQVPDPAQSRQAESSHVTATRRPCACRPRAFRIAARPFRPAGPRVLLPVTSVRGCRSDPRAHGTCRG